MQANDAADHPGPDQESIHASVHDVLPQCAIAPICDRLEVNDAEITGRSQAISHNLKMNGIMIAAPTVEHIIRECMQRYGYELETAALKAYKVIDRYLGSVDLSLDDAINQVES